MHQIPSLRLLYLSSFPLLSPLKPSLSFSLFSNPKPRTLFTAIASSSSRRRYRHVPHRPLGPGRRNSSTFRERKGQDEQVLMGENESVGFNKRRAEGRDKNDKPKTLQLKVRKLNPVNTISYVQVYFGFYLSRGRKKNLFFIFVFWLCFWFEM